MIDARTEALAAPATASPLLTSSARVLFFDYFRIPYEIVEGESPLAGFCEARGASGRSVYWPADGESGTYRLGDVTLFGRVVADGAVAARLGGAADGWAPHLPVEDAAGARVASIWRSDDGSLLLPFDPDEAILNYWSEEYRLIGTSRLQARLLATARAAYYRVRPFVPRAVQLKARRLFNRVQGRARFPRWPVETSLHELFAQLFDVFAVAAGGPLPWIAPWPDGRRWALVLTHDVETAAGYAGIDALRRIETSRGFRSSWNFVPSRYRVDDRDVADLHRHGFEVGVHGLHHDGRDLKSLETLRRRLPEMRSHARRWSAVGFRSPATQRSWDLMPELGFDYDSSYPDSDPFEPQPGGCCSWLPFFNRELVELPITLPQDHTLFDVLGRTDASEWHAKTERIRRYGGMALLITHPDYMRDDRRRELYARFLDAYVDDDSAWRPLPREVSAWWRDRAASSLTRGPGGWHIVGPAAARGCVAFGPPRP